MYGLLLTPHIFTPYIISSYQFPLPLLQQKLLLVWWGEHGSMWYQEEARNRKHPPWVLLQSDEQQQKQHWLSAERQKEHLTTWVCIIFSCHFSSMTIKRCSLQLYTWQRQPKSPSRMEHPVFSWRLGLTMRRLFLWRDNSLAFWVTHLYILL